MGAVNRWAYEIASMARRYQLLIALVAEVQDMPIDEVTELWRELRGLDHGHG